MNARNIAPKYEDVHENVPLALTVAPSDIYQYWNSDNRLNDFRIWWESLMCRVRRGCQITGIYEMSSLGRLHIHATLKITNKKIFFLYCIHELLHETTICIKPIDDIVKWDLYCGKQSNDFGSFVAVKDIPISQSCFIYDTLNNKNIKPKKRK